MTRRVIDCTAMIRSFRSKDTELLFLDEDVPRFNNIERSARRKLLILHRAKSMDDLRVPPGNRLEALKGTRKGQYSIRVNDQWRICFRWTAGDAHEVEIIDYH
jgi:toxin HigB-1